MYVLRHKCHHAINIILRKGFLLARREVLDIDHSLSRLVSSYDRQERNRLLVSIVELLLEL